MHLLSNISHHVEDIIERHQHRHRSSSQRHYEYTYPALYTKTWSIKATQGELGEMGTVVGVNWEGYEHSGVLSAVYAVRWTWLVQ